MVHGDGCRFITGGALCPHSRSENVKGGIPMLKYQGTYRVLLETDVRTGKAAEFTYVPCRVRPGVNIFRFNDNTLAVYVPGTKSVNNLLKDHADIFRPFQMGGSEAVLLFDEKDMEQAAFILKPRTKGKNMNPRPKRKQNLTDEQRAVIRERLNNARLNSALREKNRVSHA